MICDICDDCIHNAVCDRKAVLERIPYMTHCTYKHTEADIINPELEKIKSDINSFKIKGYCEVNDSIYEVANSINSFNIKDGEVADSINEGLHIATIIIDCEIERLKYECDMNKEN